MRGYLYTATTGHSIVSPINLDYARNSQNVVDLSNILAADFQKIHLLADANIAKSVKSLLESDSWPDAGLTKPKTNAVFRLLNNAHLPMAAVFGVLVL